NDARILPKGTAYITDVGMVGALNSCIGAQYKLVIDNFLSGTPIRVEPEKGPISFNAVLIKIDDSGKVAEIKQINKIVE
ncbi:MAG: YmdB family metallophosphoesterase, partial [Patescibacteria group bacterium]|nr:YmdB family metallophosphoesterase [Patescibacteria group bacterium]